MTNARAESLKLALYARNSRPPKNWKPSVPGEEPPGSWRQQLTHLRDWSSRQGHVVVLEEHDAAESGADPHRPRWSAVMQEARGHHIDAIAVTRSDRVMRSVIHYHKLAEELTTLGVDLIFVDQGRSIIHADANATLVNNIMADLAQWERDILLERQLDAMTYKDGKWYGPRSQRPVGHPQQFDDSHKFRNRKGHRVHDRAKCPKCRGALEAPVLTPPASPP